MRRYLLDTTPLTGYLQGRPEAIALIDPWLDPHEVATSILVYGELAEYLMGRPDFAARDAQLRRQLRQPYGLGLIGDVDILIAATAMERGLTIVTTDADYTRVPDLTVMLLHRRTLTPMELGQM